MTQGVSRTRPAPSDAPEKLRILWVLSKLDWQGGIGRLAFGAARALAERGHSVHVAGPAPGGDPGPIPGVDVHPWPGRIGKLARLARLVPLQRAVRADVIHLHSAHPHGDVLLGLRLLRPLLGRPRILVSPHSSNAYTKRRHLLGLRVADGIVLSSQWSASQALRAGARAERVEVVPPGIDLPGDTDGARREPVVLSLGRLVPPKAVHVAIDGFALAAEGRSEWRLHIIGNGPELEALQAQAAAKSCAGRIEFLGYVPEEQKRDELSRAQIGLLTSERENSPGAVLEFQSYGVVAVASDVGWIPELARDPELEGVEAAVLFPPGDVAALGKALAALMDDTARRHAIGASARRLAAHLSWPAIAERYEHLYGAALPMRR
jgi:glycosyltransferase involved in cell wall biosynthesis